jgi:hypothetical protein
VFIAEVAAAASTALSRSTEVINVELLKACCAVEKVGRDTPEKVRDPGTTSKASPTTYARQSNKVSTELMTTVTPRRI